MEGIPFIESLKEQKTERGRTHALCLMVLELGHWSSSAFRPRLELLPLALAVLGCSDYRSGEFSGFLVE